MVQRPTKRETALAGPPLPADQYVFIFVAAANHADRRYPDPEACNISRAAPAHIAFGTGPHICLGMHLTRVESHAALERILDRAPNIRLDPEQPEPRIRGTVLRSPDAVNVLLR
jgi:cytochrome P450